MTHERFMQSISEVLGVKPRKERMYQWGLVVRDTRVFVGTMLNDPFSLFVHLEGPDAVKAFEGDRSDVQIFTHGNGAEALRLLLAGLTNMGFKPHTLLT